MQASIDMDDVIERLSLDKVVLLSQAGDEYTTRQLQQMPFRDVAPLLKTGEVLSDFRLWSARIYPKDDPRYFEREVGVADNEPFCFILTEEEQAEKSHKQKVAYNAMAARKRAARTVKAPKPELVDSGLFQW